MEAYFKAREEPVDPGKNKSVEIYPALIGNEQVEREKRGKRGL